MNIKLEIGFFILAGIAIVGGIFWIFSTEKRLRRFFMGRKAQDLEDTIGYLEDEINKLKIAKESSENEIKILHSKTKKSIRGLETIRFNPFPDQGSNQSFAIGLMNEEGDGVVISSLYSRERMSVFAKPIRGGKSEYDLTDEEGDALAKAKIS
jgi:hypothetical protein